MYQYSGFGGPMATGQTSAMGLGGQSATAFGTSGTTLGGQNLATQNTGTGMGMGTGFNQSQAFGNVPNFGGITSGYTGAQIQGIPNFGGISNNTFAQQAYNQGLQNLGGTTANVGTAGANIPNFGGITSGYAGANILGVPYFGGISNFGQQAYNQTGYTTGQNVGTSAFPTAGTLGQTVQGYHDWTQPSTLGFNPNWTQTVRQGYFTSGMTSGMVTPQGFQSNLASSAFQLQGQMAQVSSQLNSINQMINQLRQSEANNRAQLQRLQQVEMSTAAQLQQLAQAEQQATQQLQLLQQMFNQVSSQLQQPGSFAQVPVQTSTI